MKTMIFLLLVLLTPVVLSQSSGHSSIDTLINGTPGENEEDSLNMKEIQLTNSDIRSLPTTSTSHPGKVYVDFVGSGDIQKSISEGEKLKANTGMGVIFERYIYEFSYIQSYEIEGIINIASTSDSIRASFQNDVLTNRRDFGNYILNPISSKQSLYINSNIYFGYPEIKEGRFPFRRFSELCSGINFRTIASNNVWSINDTTSVNLGVIAVRLGLFHEFIPDDYRLSADKRSKLSIFLGLNYTCRAIIGDITSKENYESREMTLGSNQTFFNGIEANFGFKLNNLRAEFQMPVLFKSGYKSIDGLTNAQFLFGIKFIGGFPLEIKPRGSKEENAGNSK